MAFNPINWLLGLFSLDIGIDLGTANTLVYVKNRGIVINEPSWVTIEKRSRKPLAVGTYAKEMVGRTPADVIAVQPHADIEAANSDRASVDPEALEMVEREQGRLGRVDRARTHHLPLELGDVGAAERWLAQVEEATAGTVARLDDLAPDQVVQFREIHHASGRFVDVAANRHLDRVIVTVAERVVALSVDPVVVGVGQRRRVKAVRRAEPVPPRQPHQSSA